MQYTSPWSKALRYLLLAIVVAAALAGVFLIFGEMPADSRAALYLGVAKSLFYLLVVLVVGAFVSSLVNHLQPIEGRTIIHEFRMEFLHQLQGLRQRIHRAGHILRAWGLTNRFGHLPASINEKRANAYCTEMANLQEANSELERLILEVGHFPDSFSQHRDLKETLSSIKGYLDEVLKEYEVNWATSAGTDPIACKPLKWLLDFTDESLDGKFLTSVAKPYNRALALVRADLLPLRRKARGSAR